MGGKFTFAMRNPDMFNKDKYLAAIREAKKLKPPPELYVSFSSTGLDIAVVIKVQHRQEWTLLLPVDPVHEPIECGFTYGIASRRPIWEYIKALLCTVCQSCPFTFEFSYEDHDCGDGVVEVGYFDNATGRFVVEHRGLSAAGSGPSATGMVPGGSRAPPQRSAGAVASQHRG